MNSKLLNVEQVAELLNVKRSWVYDKVYQGQLPHYKLGALLRFDEQEIMRWLEGNKRGSDPQIRYPMQPENIGVEQEK